MSLGSPALAGRFFITWEAQIYCIFGYNIFMKVNDEYYIKVCSFLPVEIIGEKYLYDADSLCKTTNVS